MVSDKFRRQLRQEMQQWQREGLIYPEQYEQLSARYQFNALETSARNRFVVIVIGLGCVLLGLAAITFVAANWQVWSREWRSLLLLTVFVGVNATGFYLWRYPIQVWQHRFGQGLLLLGALILGANMGLMGQMFHQSGSPAPLYLLWGVGVLAMSYSLRQTMLGLLAVLLLGVGYWWGMLDSADERGAWWLQLMLQHMPLLSAAMFIPLAYWCRSRWIFGLGAIAIISSLQSNLLRVELNGGSGKSLLITLCLALPPALLWAYKDRWQSRFSPEEEPSPQSFQFITRSLAILFLGIVCYWFSFHWIWSDSWQAPAGDLEVFGGWRLIDALVLSVLAIWQWLQLARRWDLTTGAVGGLIAIATITPIWHINISPLGIFAPLIFNVVLFLLAAGCLREGLGSGDRRLFWCGMVLLSLQIFSRMFEYNTDLIFKALMLFLCGAAIIAAGIWFERYVRTLNPPENP